MFLLFKYSIFHFFFNFISFFLQLYFLKFTKLLYVKQSFFLFPSFTSVSFSTFDWLHFLAFFTHTLFFKKVTMSLHCKSKKHSSYLNYSKIKKFIRWSSRYKRWWWSVSNIFLSASTLAFFIRSEFTKNKSLSTIFKMLKSSIPFNVKGFLLLLKGRPHGSPRSTKKKIKLGYLHFTRSTDFIDFFFLKMQNRFGICGLKIWINTIAI